MKFRLAGLMAVAAVVLAACQPPPPAPPERITLRLELQASIPLVAIGYDVAPQWISRTYFLRSIPGYEFCAPQVVSNDIPTELIEDQVEEEGETLFLSAWFYDPGTVTFSVLNNRACWDERLWDQFGGHPYQTGWTSSVTTVDFPGDRATTYDDELQLPRGAYTVVK